MTVKESPHEEYDRGFSNGWDACAARTQPAQAVPASCGECGKKTSDGWALYCVACMEKAGLPAQAGRVLTDGFIKAEALEAFDCYWDADDETLVNKYGHGVYLSRFIDFARAIEQAVLAKRVPMTDAQMLAAFAGAHPQDHADMQDGSPANAIERIGARAVYRRFERGVRAAERHHGIGGEKDTPHGS